MIIPLADMRLLVAHRSDLVIHDIDTGARSTVDVGTGSIIRFARGDDGYFAVKHHTFSEPPVRLITAHHVDDPGVAVSTLEIHDDFSVTATGDTNAWTRLPALYNLVFPYLLRLADGGAQILRLPGIPGMPEDPDDPYKLIPCPGTDRAIVSSSRGGGRFVVYDLTTAAIAAEPSYGRGTPVFRFHPTVTWLSHTDTIFALDPDSWEVRQAVRLRDTIRGGLISDMAFSPDGKRCAVTYSDSRPIPLMLPYRIAPVAGSVLVFDVEGMTVTHGGPLQRWADEVAFVGETRVAARERGADLNIEIVETEPLEWPLFPPRDPGEEWM